jgi:hypothetical protein
MIWRQRLGFRRTADVSFRTGLMERLPADVVICRYPVPESQYELWWQLFETSSLVLLLYSYKENANETFAQSND